MKSNPSEKKLQLHNIGPNPRTIHVDYLARVEGEGAFHIIMEGDKVKETRLKIFEPPRFFEGFMCGRDCAEAPDITARICGICPVAYQMSSINAMEQALKIQVPDYIRLLRRLTYCGEWIESHTLHVYMLHAPDFLGYSDVVAMAKDHPEMVKRGLRLKKAGNELIRTLGGREIHPVNLKVGGFYRLPSRQTLSSLTEELKKAREDALNTVTWVSAFPFPDLKRSYEFVAASDPLGYPIGNGTVTSSSGLNIPAEQFEDHFEEYHVAHSTALYSYTKPDKKPYFVGPMARYNLHKDQLSPLVKEAARSIGFEDYCNNPFRSIIVRSLEMLYACDEAIRLIEEYDAEGQPASVPFQRMAGVGHGVSEAPRGLLYHRYTLDEKGRIVNAKIAAPTSQNQKSIEEDLFDFVTKNIALPDDELRHRCEQTIRNYDPCISCSTHFLRLERTL